MKVRLTPPRHLVRRCVHLPEFSLPFSPFDMPRQRYNCYEKEDEGASNSGAASDSGDDPEFVPKPEDLASDGDSDDGVEESGGPKTSRSAGPQKKAPRRVKSTVSKSSKPPASDDSSNMELFGGDLDEDKDVLGDPELWDDQMLRYPRPVYEHQSSPLDKGELGCLYCFKMFEYVEDFLYHVFWHLEDEYLLRCCKCGIMKRRDWASEFDKPDKHKCVPSNWPAKKHFPCQKDILQVTKTSLLRDLLNLFDKLYNDGNLDIHYTLFELQGAFDNWQIRVYQEGFRLPRVGYGTGAFWRKPSTQAKRPVVMYPAFAANLRYSMDLKRWMFQTNMPDNWRPDYAPQLGIRARNRAWLGVARNQQTFGHPRINKEDLQFTGIVPKTEKPSSSKGEPSKSEQPKTKKSASTSKSTESSTESKAPVDLRSKIPRTRTEKLYEDIHPGIQPSAESADSLIKQRAELELKIQAALRAEGRPQQSVESLTETFQTSISTQLIPVTARLGPIVSGRIDDDRLVEQSSERDPPVENPPGYEADKELFGGLTLGEVASKSPAPPVKLIRNRSGQSSRDVSDPEHSKVQSSEPEVEETPAPENVESTEPSVQSPPKLKTGSRQSSPTKPAGSTKTALKDSTTATPKVTPKSTSTLKPAATPKTTPTVTTQATAKSTSIFATPDTSSLPPSGRSTGGRTLRSSTKASTSSVVTRSASAKSTQKPITELIQEAIQKAKVRAAQRERAKESPSTVDQSTLPQRSGSKRLHSATPSGPADVISEWLKNSPSILSAEDKASREPVVLDAFSILAAPTPKHLDLGYQLVALPDEDMSTLFELIKMKRITAASSGTPISDPTPESGRMTDSMVTDMASITAAGGVVSHHIAPPEVLSDAEPPAKRLRSQAAPKDTVPSEGKPRAVPTGSKTSSSSEAKDSTKSKTLSFPTRTVLNEKDQAVNEHQLRQLRFQQPDSSSNPLVDEIRDKVTIYYPTSFPVVEGDFVSYPAYMWRRGMFVVLKFPKTLGTLTDILKVYTDFRPLSPQMITVNRQTHRADFNLLRNIWTIEVKPRSRFEAQSPPHGMFGDEDDIEII
jgi:hypothetical protein